MKKIIIQREQWQARVAVVDNENRLQDLYFESRARPELEKCFFKGKVSKILPGIQTAFVDIGQARSGFLHITEVDRARSVESSTEDLDGDVADLDLPVETSGLIPKNQMDISKIFKEGDSILVQVIKEPVGEKGAKLSTCFTLPGKFIVLMPNISQIGVSRKIDDPAERERLKTIVTSYLPTGMGAIIRTTAENKSSENITKDLAMLVSVWHSINKKLKSAEVGEKIHEDLPIPLRAVREHLDNDIEAVICDSQDDFQGIQRFIKYFMPDQLHLLRLYTETIPAFEYFGVEKQVNPLLDKKVYLKSGGSLIIESTEAMTVIDVNTGKFIGKGSMENTILTTNLEAAEEVVRQLRLRNIGGLIVIDFIDMYKSSNRQKLSRFLEKELKERDKFQSVTLKVSEFGLVQMTRKRSGRTLVQNLTDECFQCKGNGFVKSAAADAYAVLSGVSRDIKKDIPNSRMTLSVGSRVYHYLLNTEFSAILQIERLVGHKVELSCNYHFEGSHYHLSKTTGS
ncbi:Rne/Rng family ribonuclease [Candidatus Dependentiae bacterium]|nr:Rne/Rng family ribonuclease [Candidatus Dependentiae bacterium]